VLFEFLTMVGLVAKLQGPFHLYFVMTNPRVFNFVDPNVLGKGTAGPIPRGPVKFAAPADHSSSRRSGVH
jgi:hypothetical protein